MKIPLMLVCVFAAFILCLPLAAIGPGVPVRAGKPTAGAGDKAAGSPVQQGSPGQQGSPVQQGSPAQEGSPVQQGSPGQQGSPAQQGSPGQQGKQALSVAKVSFELPDSFRILNTATGKVQKVKRADYVRGAVAAEMPPSFHTEALKAQAVAANTYAIRCHVNQQSSPDPALNGADFSADPGNWHGYITEKQAEERFGDLFDAYWGKLSSAADIGAQYVLVYEDEPIVAAYHSISAGRTEYASNVWQGDAPYLVPAESFGDTLAPNYETVVQFSADEVSAVLRAENSEVALGKEKDDWLWVVSRSASGYALEVEAGGQSFSGLDIRRMFGLRSSDFDIAQNGGTFTFTVRGYGHGVGLSQYGADYMARQGAAFDEILNHYYTDCLIAE